MTRHTLTRDCPVAALVRYAHQQLGSKLRNGLAAAQKRLVLEQWV